MTDEESESEIMNRVVGQDNVPMIDGAQVWERETPLSHGTFVESLGLPDDNDPVPLDREFLESLLLKAGYVYRGIAKGGHTCWQQQVEAGDT